MLPQGVNKGLEAFGDQQFRGVGRYGTHRQQVQVVTEVLDVGQRVVRFTGEVGGDTGVVLADRLRQRGFTDVQVNDQGLGILESHGCGQVQQREGFAGVGVKGGEHDHLGRFAGGADKEVQIGTQYTEGLVDGVSLAGFYHNTGVAVVEAVGYQAFPVVFAQAHLRNLAYERNR